MSVDGVGLLLGVGNRNFAVGQSRLQQYLQGKTKSVIEYPCDERQTALHPTKQQRLLSCQKISLWHKKNKKNTKQNQTKKKGKKTKQKTKQNETKKRSQMSYIFYHPSGDLQHGDGEGGSDSDADLRRRQFLVKGETSGVEIDAGFVHAERERRRDFDAREDPRPRDDGVQLFVAPQRRGQVVAMHLQRPLMSLVAPLPKADQDGVVAGVTLDDHGAALMGPFDVAHQNRIVVVQIRLAPFERRQRVDGNQVRAGVDDGWCGSEGRRSGGGTGSSSGRSALWDKIGSF